MGVAACGKGRGYQSNRVASAARADRLVGAPEPIKSRVLDRPDPTTPQNGRVRPLCRGALTRMHSIQAPKTQPPSWPRAHVRGRCRSAHGHRSPRPKGPRAIPGSARHAADLPARGYVPCGRSPPGCSKASYAHLPATSSTCLHRIPAPKRAWRLQSRRMTVLPQLASLRYTRIMSSAISKFKGFPVWRSTAATL